MLLVFTKNSPKKKENFMRIDLSFICEFSLPILEYLTNSYLSILYIYLKNPFSYDRKKYYASTLLISGCTEYY